MNLSMKWLYDFVKADMPVKEFVDAMTMSGSKVETYEIQGEKIKNVVVGKVISIEKAPDSDRLNICMVDVGDGEPLQIVTAATNVFAGAIVPVALHKSVLADGTKITRGKLRGIVSNGMLCSFAELGMEQEDFPYAIKDGILILNNDPEIEKMKIGMDIREAVGFNDISVEFEITNNRPDCLSVIGLAKEASATFEIPMNYKEPTFKGVGGKISDFIKVNVQNKELCSRYMAAVVKNVKIGPSPRWLAERLRASGVRSINNFVDITNFVMLEYGHPMHAFDLRYVDNAEINVRNAVDGEKITILDGSEIALSSEMLVIADGKKPVAIAGIMGGEYSGIMDDTTTVVFESACFDGVSVRKTAKKINKRTESSSRFEKGIDPINAKAALMRALELVEELGCGEVITEYIDIDNANKTPHRLKHDHEWISRFLGIEIPESEQIRILKSLGFGYEDGFAIVPNTRIDIERQCDLAEEVARIYGYNRIPSTTPRLSSNAKRTPEQVFSRQLVDVMLAQGCFETETFSFISPKAYEKIRLPEEQRKSVTIINPLGEDTSVMRTTVIPSMLEVIANNFNDRNLAGRFFEISRKFVPRENALPDEKEVLSIGFYGSDEDFFTLKGAVEAVFNHFDIDAEYKAQRENPTFHPGKCAEVFANGKKLGTLGEIHPEVCEAFGISARVYVAAFYMDGLFAARGGERLYKPLPKFPAMTRDLSLVCDEGTTNGFIIDTIKKTAANLESVSLFDVFRGEQIGEGKKCLSYKLVMRKSDSTMVDGEADSAVAAVLAELEKNGVALRK